MTADPRHPERRLRTAFRLPWRTQRQIDRDFEEEIRFHHDMRVAELIEKGMAPEAARLTARSEYGDLDDARRYVGAVDRAMEAAERRQELMREIGRDIGHAVRRLRRAPAFALTAVLTLALGVGACTLAFSIASAVLLRPLPFLSPEQVVLVWGSFPQYNLGFSEFPIHGRHFSAIRDDARAFTSIAAFRSTAVNLMGAGAPERLDGIEATGDFFNAIGVRPWIGRFFTRTEEAPGSDHVAVLAYDTWRRQFGGDSAVLGRVVSLNTEPFTVIGVAPPGFSFPRGAEMPGDFQFPARADVWVPLAPPKGGPSDLAVVGRLTPGMTMEAAQHDLDRVRDNLIRQFPEQKNSLGTSLVPLRVQLTGKAQPIVLTLLLAVGVVLLIACVNTAQLQLARQQQRRHDAAIRAALGASRARLARELMVEVLALAAVAGLLGAFAAWITLGVVRAHGSAALPFLADASFNVPTLVAAFAVTTVAGLLASLLPAVLASRVALSDALRRGAKGAGGRAGAVRARRLLIATELTLSVVLVSSAGLLIRSLSRQLTSATGFAAPNGVTFEVTLPMLRYAEHWGATGFEHPAAVQFFTAALERMRAIPGVRAAAIGKPLPLSGAQEASVFTVDGAAPLPAGTSMPIAEYTIASKGMFQALGTPMHAGRDFAPSDDGNGPRVIIVNEAMAHWLWPDQSAIGKRILVGGPGSRFPAMTVIGVAGDMKRYTLTESPRPEMIVPYTQHPYPTFATMQFVVRAALPASVLVPALRGAIAAVDPTVPISRVRTIDDLIGEASASARFTTQFVTTLGASALALAMIGLYGVIAYSVSQRRREFGVRRALGAAPADIVSLVASEGLHLTALGLLAGVALSLGAGRLLGHLLYQVSVFDPVTFVGTIVLLALAATVACLAPAWRAMHVEPRVALEEA